MAKPPCEVKLEGPKAVTYSDGPGTRWELVPADFVARNDCKLEMRINGELVTGTGVFGGEHVTAYASYAGISIQPPANKQGKVTFRIICPNCENDLPPADLMILPARRSTLKRDDPVEGVILAGVCAATAATIGGVAFGPLGAVAGACIGAFVGFVILIGISLLN